MLLKVIVMKHWNGFHNWSLKAVKKIFFFFLGRERERKRVVIPLAHNVIQHNALWMNRY